MPLRILLLEDSPIDAELAERTLRSAGFDFTLTRVDNEAAICNAVAELAPDVVIADYNLPDIKGEKSLALLRALAPSAPVIFLSGTIGEETAVELLRNGATDYVLKDRLERLPLVLRRAVAESEQRAARQAAEEAMRASEQRYRSLFDNSLDAIFSLGPDGAFITANLAAQAVSGYSLPELQTIHFLELCPPDQRIQARTAFQDALCHQCKAFDVVIQTKSGARKDLYVTGAPVIVDGQITGVSCIARDITERKKAVRLLADNEERWRVVLEAALLGAWVMDLSDFTVWRSPLHDQIFGYETPVPVWTHETFLEHVVKEERDVVKKRFSSGLNDNASFAMECRIRRKDGELRWIWVNGRVQDDINDVPRLFGVVQDITNHKLAELALRDADRRKDEFLAMLGHELRNPLAAIGGAVALIKEPGIEAESIRAAHTIIEHQTLHLGRIVDDLLDVARVARGQILLRKKPVDAAEVVGAAIRAASPLIELHRHHVDFTVPAEGPVRVDADPTRLEQIIGNLLVNAIKYTGNDGRIEIAVEREGEEAVIKVRDNGVGIPSDVLPHVFDLFSQGTRTLARTDGGLGIGLNLCRRLIELHGGTITAHSAGRSQGSEFVIRMPALPAASAPKPTKPSQDSDAPRASLKILVVDDNLDTTRMLSRLLKRRGHTVEVANDGLEGLQRAREFQPEALLLDIGLPGMDGYELATQLRSDGLNRALFFAISGYAQESDVERALKAGFDRHLSKPIDFEELLRLLETANQTV